MVVMAAATSSITEASPYIVRTSFTLPQVVGGDGRLGGQERHQEGRHAGRRLRPGPRRREVLQERFQLNGGKVIGESASPLRNPDFAPFLQKVRDAQARRAVRVRAVGRRARRS